MRILYIVSIEDIVRSPVVRSQVIELLKAESKDKSFKLKLYILSLYPVLNYLKLMNSIKRLQKELAEYEICLKVIPIFMLTRFFYMNLFILLLYTFQIIFISIWIKVRINPYLLHCRSYPATLMGLFMRIFFNRQFIFDMRGLYPEEGVIHKKFRRGSSSFRIWKLLERNFIKRAYSTVVVSRPLYEFIKKESPESDILMIPTCAKVPALEEVEKHSKEMRKELGITDKIVVCYNGAVQSWYAPDLIISALKRLVSLMPEVEWYFLFLIIGKEDLITDGIKKEEALSEIPYKIFSSLPQQEVLKYLAAADFGLIPRVSFPTSFSIISVKFVEYIACGVPVLCSESIGGAVELIKRYNLGVLYDAGSGDELKEEVNDFIKHRGRCRKKVWGTGKDIFSFESCAKEYRMLYKKFKKVSITS